MAILARFKDQQVEILDVYDYPEGKVASLRAVDGKPFIGGDKWPVRTEYTTAPIGELSNITSQDDKPHNPTLLDQALSAARNHWPNGETVWVWHNGKSSAFLKAYTGEVRLHVTGYTPSLRVFILDPTNGWHVARNVRADYQAWATKARKVVK